MTGQVQKVIIGGVQYDRNNVKSSGQKDGTHTVELKDGTTITYKTQAQGNEAQVTVNKDKTVVFSGLAGATITDVAGQDDKYLFSGSQNCTVKARHTSVFTKDSDQFYSFSFDCPVFLTRNCPFSIVYSWYLCHNLIDHMYVGLFLGSLFCSIDLCTCFYAKTILF